MTRAIATLVSALALSACGTGDPMATGKAVYAKACASCHGADLEGSVAAHAPNLKDGIWLFASDDLDAPYGVLHPADIEHSIRWGIHADNEKARNPARMPALSPRLTPGEIVDVAEYVVAFRGEPHDAAKAARGKIVYDDEGECFDCHGWTGKGDGAIGSTDFTRNLWLWGGDRARIMESVTKGRVGICPPQQGKLPDEEIKAVAAYVLSRNPSPGPK